MENSFFKFAFVVSLLVFAAGVQFGAEARNVSLPCLTTADCGDPVHCKCEEATRMCICHREEKGSIAEDRYGVPRKCNTSADCDSHCKCDEGLHLCNCVQEESIAEAMNIGRKGSSP